jgi:hypothetical protein
LTNKGRIWHSNDKWNFKNYNDDTMIYIENMSKNKILGVKNCCNDDKVIEEPMIKCKLGQLWEKGNVDKEGYFTLRNSESAMILTAISTKSLAIKGNIKTFYAIFRLFYNMSFKIFERLGYEMMNQLHIRNNLSQAST